MKKLLLLSSIMFVVTSFNKVNAQFVEGDKFINIGLGLGSYFVSGSGFSTTLPPIEASAEFMVNENISVGGFIGAYSAKFESSFNSIGGNINSETKFNYLNFGGVGNYHFVNTDIFNVYAGARLGYLSQGGDTTVEDDLGGSSSLDVNSSGVLFGIQIGARYHLSELFALNAELGYGIAVFKVGGTIKF